MEEKNQLGLSVIIPVYGSAEILPELTSQLQATFDNIKSLRDKYEVIFVCDNSPDNSWSVITSLAEENSFVRGILLRVNGGQHNALMAGFAQASGNVIVTMDDDLQHSPSDIPAMLACIENGSDVVFAKFKKRNHAAWKIAGSMINDVAAGVLLDKPKNLYLSPFRAFKSSICEEILKYKGPYVYVDGLILSVTHNITTVVVDHHNRFVDGGAYGFKKSIALWMKMATSFSVMPLRITSILGVILAGLGFLLAIGLVVQKFTYDSMPNGWSSLMVTVLILGGIQLLGIGMLGEYLGRALLTINSKPQYVVSKKIGFHRANPNGLIDIRKFK